MVRVPKTFRALVVDDSPLVRRRVTVALARIGFAIVEAGSFAEAAAIDPMGFTCALLDLDLGDGNGADLAEIYRGKAPELPIAFFSSETSGIIWTKAQTYGMAFTKPDGLESAVAWAKALLE